jgi:hypothetical protein
LFNSSHGYCCLLIWKGRGWFACKSKSRTKLSSIEVMHVCGCVRVGVFQVKTLNFFCWPTFSKMSFTWSQSIVDRLTSGSHGPVDLESAAKRNETKRKEKLWPNWIKYNWRRWLIYLLLNKKIKEVLTLKL